MAKNLEYAEGEVIANKYVVESLLGESPSARLYLVNGNFSSQKLAVKIYRPEVSSVLLSASDFFLKAGVMTEVENDNLTATLDVQTEMDLVFVARPFAEGKSFESYLKNPDSDTPHYLRGLEILWQICQGLSALHERTHHLNIHPGNIIVGPLVAKLCDWDPRALGSMEMTPEPLPIRPDYMGYRAPEMLSRGAFLSYPSTDLYAIAGLLYRLIKGQNPSVNPAQTLGDTRAFDKDLAVFFGKALHPKPEERFQEASAFSDALWELKPAMERLQQRKGTAVTEPFSSPEQKSSLETKPAGSGDTFFNFFPTADSAPTPTTQAQSNFFPKVTPDTEFGAPPIPMVKAPTTFTPKPVQPLAPPPPPTPPPLYNPPRSGMDSLESASGTLFGSPAPLFGSQNKPAPRPEPIKPIVAKPMAVSLSSLENDPLERADGNMTAGFTQFGFKDAGENRTGIYNPEGKAIAAKAKLTLLFTILGVVIVIIGLGALFVILRSHAAAKDAIQAANKLPDPKPDPAESGEPFSDVQANGTSATTHPATSAAATPSSSAPPYPDAASNPEPIPENKPVAAQTPQATPPKAAQPSAKAAPVDNTPPEPFPVQEPPEPQALAKQHSDAKPAPSSAAVSVRTPSTSHSAAAPTQSSAPSSAVSSNTKVTPERQAALMAIIQNRTWPASASERLRMADDFNDMGKIAEANMAYAKTMSATDVTNKQKISALGGLAVTFQSMGMKDQALESVDKLLQINPNNSFAQKMKAKLK